MFAFAIWDSRKRTLLIVRDRVGIKPLYYSISDQGLSFASEIKAIITDGTFDKEIDFSAIDRFLSFFYIPGDLTLFKRIKKLLPGHYLIYESGKLRTEKYWDLSFSTQYKKPFNIARTELLDLIRESVRLHMISDVPVGLLLSGGVDSTALLSLAIHETSKDISTFTIGFEGRSFADERYYAGIAARKYGTKHYDMTITAKDFHDFLPSYISFMEEPVCEPPAIALYYVSRLARNYVKVLISGEGGDEAFAGYRNYRNLVWLDNARKLNPLCGKVLSSLSTLNTRLPFVKSLSPYKSFLNQELSQSYLSRTSSPGSFFNASYKHLYGDAFLRKINRETTGQLLKKYATDCDSKSLLGKLLYIDTKTWLPDDLLVKADKMTMANSVELRVPLLDHKVLEFAASLPESFKLHQFSTKRILKKAFGNLVPHEILHRKKTGFPVPFGDWLRNDLKDYVHETLLSARAQSRGYFKKSAVAEILSKGSNSGNYSKEIFSLLVLELWHNRFVDQAV
jgi:asparagine synthase (glutamine-hydrolysing)